MVFHYPMLERIRFLSKQLKHINSSEITISSESISNPADIFKITSPFLLQVQNNSLFSCIYTLHFTRNLMIMKNTSILISLTILALLSGCVTGRRTIDLGVPTLQIAEGQNGTVSIKTIEDNRTFENKPSSPSIPSIDGDVNSMSSAAKSKMIGRQRNGYGKAAGDISLPEGETVESKSLAMISEVFKARGYSISEDENSDFQLDVNINEFWAWFSPGMFSVSFEAKIECEISIVGSSKNETIKVEGYGINKGQVASDENWQLAYKRAFDDFYLKLDEALTAKGF